MKDRVCVVACFLALVAASAPAMASILDFTDALGLLEAEATFEASGSDLLVTLTNTSGNDVVDPSEVLTGLFWDVTGSPALTPVSAWLSGGSTVFFGPDGGGNVGGEWAYEEGLSGAPGGTAYGISSAGLGLFGAPAFGGANLQGPAAVDGLSYGLTSAGDDTSTGNAAVTGGFPLIKNAVQFTLSGLPTGFEPQQRVTNIWFQYGTSLTEPTYGGGNEVPEVPAYALAVLGLLPLGLRWRRRR